MTFTTLLAVRPLLKLKKLQFMPKNLKEDILLYAFSECLSLYKENYIIENFCYVYKISEKKRANLQICFTSCVDGYFYSFFKRLLSLKTSYRICELKFENPRHPLCLLLMLLTTSVSILHEYTVSILHE